MGKINKKTKIIILSLIGLFLAIILIYVIFFKVKGNVIKEAKEQKIEQSEKNVVQVDKPNNTQNIKSNQTNPETNTGSVKDVQINNDNNQIQYSNMSGTQVQMGSGVNQDIMTGMNVENITPVDTAQMSGSVDVISVPGNEIVDNQQQVHQPTQLQSQYFLSGTYTYYGGLEVFAYLSVSYDYILEDLNGVKYAYLTGDISSIKESVESLGGTVFKIDNQQILEENMLFGDEVLYINLPEYKDKKVYLIVTKKSYNHNWLLEIDYNMYYKLKPYMQVLFSY